MIQSFILLLAIAGPPLPPPENVTVHDGDTIIVDFPTLPDVFGKRIEIRLNGIDTPELRDKDPVVRRKAASGAKVQIGKSGKFCGQSAVQMHGGMGVTDEMAVSHYFKRLTMIDLMFGNQQHHLTRYSNLAMAA